MAYMVGIHAGESLVGWPACVVAWVDPGSSAHGRILDPQHMGGSWILGHTHHPCAQGSRSARSSGRSRGVHLRAA